MVIKLKRLKELILRIYLWWCLFVFGVIMVTHTPFVLLLHLLGRRFGKYSFYVVQQWTCLFSKLTAIRIKAVGLENVRKDNAFIYVANHNSVLDAIAVACAIPYHFAALGKVELTKIPFLGWVFNKIMVQVDRSNPDSRTRSIKALMRVLRNERTSILIFPEGTMNRSNALLTPFYDGAFRIAIETQAPLLPVIMKNSRNLMPPGTFRIKPGTIEVIFEKPTPVEGLTLRDIPALKKSIYQQMLTILEDHKANPLLPENSKSNSPDVTKL